MQLAGDKKKKRKRQRKSNIANSRAPRPLARCSILLISAIAVVPRGLSCFLFCNLYSQFSLSSDMYAFYIKLRRLRDTTKHAVWMHGADMGRRKGSRGLRAAADRCRRRHECHGKGVCELVSGYVCGLRFAARANADFVVNSLILLSVSQCWTCHASV